MAEVKLLITGDSASARAAVKSLETEGTSANRRLETSTRSLSAVYASLGSVIGGISVAALVNGMKDARVEIDAVNASLKTTFGARAAEELAFVRRESDRLGLSAMATAKSYGSLAAAARGTVLEGELTKEIFLGISEAGSALGRSGYDIAGMLNAVQQMMSKGTVQAEELRGQLSERLPGAFKMAAEAMGISERQLNKMLERGEVLATDLLPKLARALREQYGQAAVDAAHNAQQELNRMGNAWDLLMAKASGSVPLVSSISTSADALKGLADNLEEVVRGAELLAGVGLAVVIGRITNSAKGEAAGWLANAAAARVSAAATTSQAAAYMGLVPALNASAAASRANAAAMTASAVASRAAAGATTLAEGALAALGGPIGLVITLLGTAAAAWMTYGNSADEAREKAGKSAADILQALETDTAAAQGNLVPSAFLEGTRRLEQLKANRAALIAEQETLKSTIDRFADDDSPYNSQRDAAWGRLAQTRINLSDIEKEASALEKALLANKAARATASPAAAEAGDREGLLETYKQSARLIVEVEKDRLKIMGDAEQDAAKRAQDLVKQKADEISAFKDVIAEALNQVSAVERQVAAEKAAAVAVEQNAYDARLSALDSLGQKEREVDRIADPAKRAEELGKLLPEYAKLTKEVELGGQVVINQEQAWDDVTEAADRLRQKIGETSDTQVAALERQQQLQRDAWSAAMVAANDYRLKIDDLGRVLEALGNKKIVIDFQAPGLDELLAKSAALASAAAGAGRTDYGDYYTQNGQIFWGDGSYAGETRDFPGQFPAPGTITGTPLSSVQPQPISTSSFAVGTKYVARTGLDQVHRGEEFRNSREGAINRETSNVSTMTIGSINLTLPNVTDKTRASDLARELFPELQKLSRRSAG